MRYIIISSLLLGAGLIVLLSLGASNTEFFADNLPLLLGMTALAALALAILFGFQVYSLWRRIRSGVFGSRLTARLFWTLGLMSLIPGLIVYGVSVQFIVRSIESWFDVRVEQALESGLALGQSALEHLERDHIKKAEVIAQQLSEMPPVLHISRLNSLRESVGLREIALSDAEGRLLGFASSDKADLMPTAPERDAIWQARLQQPWSRIEQSDDGKSLVIRVVVPVNLVSLTETLRLLQVTQPVPAKLSEDAQSVEMTHRAYQELAVSKLGLKRLYGLALTLTLALTLFATLAIAFILSERMTAPLRALARGTRAVARGDFSQVQASARKDELGMLTQSFNRMTQQLSDARETADESRNQLAETKNYLESILGSVSTAVVTLDQELRIHLVNPAAASILGVESDAIKGSPLRDCGPAGTSLGRFGAHMERHFREHGLEPWREQVELATDAGVRQLLARGTPLTSGATPEFALVFDDITQLLQAQRDAAWGEVARRMAHEIKNPLTPIQLSAERLRNKFGKQVSDNRELFEQLTQTIERQTGQIKSMVDEFASFARMPAPQMAEGDLRLPVQEPVILFRESNKDIDFKLTLPDAPVKTRFDTRLISQAMTNLVKNATEAIEGFGPAQGRPEGYRGRIEVHMEQDGERVTIEVMDNGIGLPKQNRSRLLEPYVTTRAKGTGLGLAIVQKIVEQHGGTLSLEDAPLNETRTRGAMLRVVLPVKGVPPSEARNGSGGAAHAEASAARSA